MDQKGVQHPFHVPTDMFLYFVFCKNNYVSSKLSKLAQELYEMVITGRGYAR